MKPDDLSVDILPAEPYATLGEATRSVECPRCHQPPGKPCRSPAHSQSTSHTARRVEAFRVDAVVVVPRQEAS